MAVSRTILTTEAFTIAYFKAFVPKFPNHYVEVVETLTIFRCASISCFQVVTKGRVQNPQSRKVSVRGVPPPPPRGLNGQKFSVKLAKKT